jgi:large subunit ribosomal protein L24
MKTVETAHKRVTIRHNDTVKVIAGRDKGKEGRVLRVFPDEGKALVEHVMLVKKHVRPNPQRNVKGGIAEQESRISLSNVQLVCPTCGPVRVGHEERGGRKVRVCKKCDTTLDK